MITKIQPKQSIGQLIGNCVGKVDNGSIKLQCSWSKVLRFAPGMKFRPDELFEVFERFFFKISIKIIDEVVRNEYIRRANESTRVCTVDVNVMCESVRVAEGS